MNAPDTPPPLRLPHQIPTAPPPAGDLALVAALCRYPLLLASEAERVAARGRPEPAGRGRGEGRAAA